MLARLRAPAALAALAAALLAPATFAAPAHAGGFRGLVPRGGVRLPAGARELGRLPGDAEIRAIVTLTPRNPRGLAAYAAAVSTPGSPLHHRYLSREAFARRFAPTAAQVRAVRARLAASGLALGPTTANRLSIPVRAPAARIDAAFSTEIVQYTLRSGAHGDVPASPARLRGGAGRLVQGVVGLDTLAPHASLRFARRDAAAHLAGLSANATTTPSTMTSAGPQACGSASALASASGGQLPSSIAAHYGLSNFYAAGDEGRGVTVALYELEPFSVSDVAGYESCMGTSTPVSVESIDGGAGTGAGSGEAAMDVEDVIGLAPQAQIRVYEGPQTAAGAYATYAQIVADDAAQVISTSWGLCEPELGTATAEAEDTLFQEAAVQGQTVVAADGDDGADDCGNGTRSVDDPAALPYVTAVGGTTLHAGADTVWDGSLGATGGGASSLWPRPAWQTASQAQSVVSCGSGGDSCRELPDLSVDADPNTGYLAYYQGAWRLVGGTSAAAPTVASLAALADASPVCASNRLGFLAPVLYGLAGDFTDVTSGTNGFDGVTGYSAATGYDMASGLGTPTAALGPALCGDAVTLVTPATQSWATGRAASLALSAASARGAAISWTASGLPAGMSLTAGRIAGTPTAAGTFPVTVTATDAGGAQATAAFTVVVARTVVTSTSTSTATGTSAKTAALHRRRAHRRRTRRRTLRHHSTARHAAHHHVVVRRRRTHSRHRSARRGR